MTFWQRVASAWGDFLIPPDATELAERELLAEQARRLRIKTDIQEARIKAREARMAERKQYRRLFAAWRPTFQYEKKNCEATLLLQVSGTNRWVRLERMAKDAGGTVPMEYQDAVFDLLKTYDVWVGAIQPWLDGTINNEKLRKMKPKGVQFAGDL